MMFIILLLGGIFKKIVESIKVIYFTIFYTSLTRPMAIIPAIRKEITGYLLMQSDFVPQKQSNSKTQYIDQLTNYIKQYLNSGYSKQQINQFLVSKGYSQNDINNAFSKIR
jgi:hypothetical protein